MSELILPTPKTPLQGRAFTLLRALEGRQLARSALAAINNGNLQDTKHAVRFLRDHNYIYICGWGDSFEADPIYKMGCEPDVKRKRRDGTERRCPARKVISIPAPDPLLAALFGRPVPGMPQPATE